MSDHQVPVICQNIRKPFPKACLGAFAEVDCGIATEDHVEFSTHAPVRDQVELAKRDHFAHLVIYGDLPLICGPLRDQDVTPTGGNGLELILWEQRLLCCMNDLRVEVRCQYFDVMVANPGQNL